MNYTCQITTNRPVEAVVALWENPTHFKEWQDGFKSIIHLSGTPNTVGAKSKISFEGKVKWN